VGSKVFFSHARRREEEAARWSGFFELEESFMKKRSRDLKFSDRKGRARQKLMLWESGAASKAGG